VRGLISRKVNFYSERRNSWERRANSIPSFKYWGRWGRRCQVRRRGEQTGIYLDWYPAPILWAASLILCLCLMDAIFTLSLLQRGAVEINPLMAILIGTSIPLFVGVKVVVTILSLVLLIVHYNFIVLRLFRVQQLIYSVLFLYVGIITYENLLWLAWPLS
jgi:hypothetical protein